MRRLKVLVADDHRVMLAGIRRALEASDEMDVVAEARTGMLVIPAIAATNPDVVLLDIRMPELDGMTCLARIRERYPRLPVVMLSSYGDAEHVEAARSGGANAYVSKRVDPLVLPGLVRRIVDGALFAVHGLEPTPADANEDGLTERELTVLRAVARGLSNRDIGEELWMSAVTVKFHLRNIYRKLEISSRGEATRYALEHGLVEMPVAVGL